MAELAHEFVIGTVMVISPRLKGGIPQYDIVDGERIEVGHIHAMRVDGKLLVSEELYKEIMRGDFNESTRD